LNLAILLLAILGLAGARLHRGRLDRQFDALLRTSDSAPAEMRRLRAELAELDLTRDALGKELDSRMAYMESQRSDQFYLAIDTSRRKLMLHYGDDIVREADVQIGPPANLESPEGQRWTFVPLKGAFVVRGKQTGVGWHVPVWAYLMNRQRPPATRPTIENGIGRYVVYLPNNYLIHSPPAAESPLKGPKPGSFMVPEDDLRAIWPRIDQNTRVFIF
jgi:hypothetical protein